MISKPDIIETIERAGFDPKRKGRAFWLSCPFHQDKTPSFKIDPERQIFFCYSCQSGGDSITFIMKLHSLSFKDALRYLNIDGKQTVRIDPKEQTKRDLLKAFRAWGRDYYHWLTCYYRAFNDLKMNFKTMDDVVKFEDIFNQMPLVEEHMNILSFGSDQERYELYEEVKVNGEI